jgi:type I restriction enzyme M protein
VPSSEELLPKARRALLEANGLVKIVGTKIRYPKLGFEDVFTDPEEKVRADIYLSLATEHGYNEPGVVEFEKYHKIGHPNKTSDAKIDIVIRTKTGAPFALFEIKSPSDYEKYLEQSIKTQLFNLAAIEDQGYGTLHYLIYATRSYSGGVLVEKLVCIDYTKFKTFEAWDHAGRPNLRTIPSNYGVLVIHKYQRGSKHDLRDEVDKAELERIRRDLHNVLWGGGRYQNELFFNLVGIFLAKIYDERETGDGEAYEFQVFFHDQEPEEPVDLYKRINETYKTALKGYLRLSDDEISRVRDIEFEPRKVFYVVEVLQGIRFTARKHDLIGEFFEGVVRGEFKQSKGQYLTHMNLVRFMVLGLQLDKLAVKLVKDSMRPPRIIDPSLGSGAFPIEAAKVVNSAVIAASDTFKKAPAMKAFMAANFHPDNPYAWAEHNVAGIEINGDLALAAKVNLVGHGIASTNVEANDALLPFDQFRSPMLRSVAADKHYGRPVNGEFDVVLSNPPFSITVDRETARLLPGVFEQGERLVSRMVRSDDAEVATELLFIERYYQLLRAGGRLAVVLPESVFDTASTREVRLFIFKFFHVKAIVSITNEAFAPYTTTKTDILFASKKYSHEISAWEQQWTDWSERYAKLQHQISDYLPGSPLTKSAIDLTRKIGRQIGVDEILTRDLALAVAPTLHQAGDLWQSALLDLIAKTLQADDQEERQFISQQISRRRSLKRLVDELHQSTFSREDFVECLRNLLGSFFADEHKDRSIPDLLREYGDEIRSADLEWWVFRQMTDGDDARIVFAHADEIGYKRGIRGEESRPNDLYRSLNGNITYNLENPENILDFVRSVVEW